METQGANAESPLARTIFGLDRVPARCVAWVSPLAWTRRARDPAALHRFCHPSCLASTRPSCCHPRRTPTTAWLGAPGIRSTPPRGGVALSSHERLWTFRSFAGGAVFDVAFRPPRIAWAAGRRPVHAAPVVVAQGAHRMRRHPTNQRHHPARPKDLEWRTAPRRTARTAGPRRHPPSRRARLPARLVGGSTFRGVEGSRCSVRAPSPTHLGKPFEPERAGYPNAMNRLLGSGGEDVCPSVTRSYPAVAAIACCGSCYDSASAM